MSQDKTPDIRVEPVAETELSHMKRSYCDAFPASERKPFALLKTRARRERQSCSPFVFDGIFAGLAVTLLDGPYVLIDYLAVSPAFRNHGIGASGLVCFAPAIPTGCFFLEIEEPETEIQNAAGTSTSETGFSRRTCCQTVRRGHAHSLRCGRNVPFDDYAALLLHTVGPYTVGNVTFRSLPRKITLKRLTRSAPLYGGAGFVLFTPA